MSRRCGSAPMWASGSKLLSLVALMEDGTGGSSQRSRRLTMRDDARPRRHPQGWRRPKGLRCNLRLDLDRVAPTRLYGLLLQKRSNLK